MNEMPRRIVEVAQQLKDGEVPRKYKVRAVLKWFGASRRGANIISDIKTALATLGLRTDPTMDDAGIDESVRFMLASSSFGNGHDSANQPPVTEALIDHASPASPLVADSVVDVTSQVASASEDQLEPESEDEQPIVKPDDRPVTSQSSDWTISALRDKLDRGQLDLQPKFQREYVWNTRPELPSRLIESLLLEIPIPPIYFGKVSEGRLEMIDGQQRLQTLVNFVSNKFALRKEP